MVNSEFVAKLEVIKEVINMFKKRLSSDIICTQTYFFKYFTNFLCVNIKKNFCFLILFL